MLIVSEELAYVLVIEQAIVRPNFDLTLHGVDLQEHARIEFEEVAKIIHWASVPTEQTKINLVSLLNSLFTKQFNKADKVIVVASYYASEFSKKKGHVRDDDSVYDEDEDDEL